MGKKVPKNCISEDEARGLQNEWCKTRAHDIKECMGFEDTREFWWSVKDLKKYLKYVKKQSKKQGIKNPGIRFYFGAYTKEQCKMGKGYATAFLSPTGSPAGAGKDGDSAENNYLIEPLNYGGSGIPPTIY